MSTAVAQIQFAAEFVTFLVAAAGLALVVLRNELTTRRPPERLALALGFLVTGAAAFGHGSLLLNADLEGVVVGLRIAGIVALGIGSIWWWRGGRVARRMLWLGLVVNAAAVGFEVAGASRASDALLAIGSIVIGAALVTASRRSVSARVAASAAGTLLLVVLVLSVALSAVLSSSIQREELNRLQARATTEASLAQDSFNNERQTAGLVGLLLYASDLQNLRTLVQAYSNGTATAPENQAVAARIASLLNSLPALLSGDGALAYLVPDKHIVAAALSAGVDQTILTELTGSTLVQRATCPAPRTVPASTELVGSTVVAFAAFPLCAGDSQNEFVGIVLRISPLDDVYLQSREQSDPSLSLAIVNPSGVAAKNGPQPSLAALRAVGKSVPANGSTFATVVGDRYVAAVPIQTTDKQTIAAFVVSAPTSVVVSTRDSLFRTLFLIALGGTLIALGLAVVIGDRITAGLRRLTMAAESIQRGEVGRRSGISSDDEVGVLGAAFDSMAASIEEQTRALQAAADDETRLRNRLEAVVAGMGDALVAVDASGAITDFNQAAEELTGISASSAVGRPVDEVLTLVNEDGASLGPRLRTPSPSRWGILATAIQTGGAEFPVAVSAGALRGPASEIAGQVLVLRDLRREREVERMKTEFLSRVGHELRTPLTGIMGYSDMLLRRSVPPERARLWQEEILESSKRLLRIVEMVEFFASSGAGRVLLRPEPLDLRQMVDAAVGPWTERLEQPHTITKRVAREPLAIIGDKRWLALAVDELIDNAVKFSPGGAHVTVAASLSAPTGGAQTNGSTKKGAPSRWVEISVADKGVGMTPEERARVFGEFVQGDSSDTRRFGGLGLGLSLVQRVVEGHGGSVQCSSTPGRGSIFTIVLPLAPSDADPPAGGRHAIGTAT
ncbi:MAG: ATP-binding protein [Actinomycetota bacterium]|nr:ATP-binding protein [Actinomycetota bacterium]